MKIVPVGTRLVVKPAKRKDETDSGLVLAHAEPDKPVKGSILAKGPGLRLPTGEFQPLPFSEGETVLYDKYSGTELEVDSETLIVLDARDVLAVLEEKR